MHYFAFYYESISLALNTFLAYLSSSWWFQQVQDFKCLLINLLYNASLSGIFDRILFLFLYNFALVSCSILFSFCLLFVFAFFLSLLSILACSRSINNKFSLNLNKPYYLTYFCLLHCCFLFWSGLRFLKWMLAI